jgi:hypothetical protein
VSPLQSKPLYFFTINLSFRGDSHNEQNGMICKRGASNDAQECAPDPPNLKALHKDYTLIANDNIYVRYRNN